MESDDDISLNGILYIKAQKFADFEEIFLSFFITFLI